METENSLENPEQTSDATETGALATERDDELSERVSLLEPELKALRGHKRECAIAFILCFGAFIGDFIRWILLLVFHNRMNAYYYNNMKLHGIIVGSICWDCICFIICAIIYNVHKQWIQLPSYGKWSRFLALYFAIITRVFMFIPMIWGNATSGAVLQGFVFLLQIVYYFGIWLAWISAMSAYAAGLIYSELPQSMPAGATDQEATQEQVQGEVHPVTNSQQNQIVTMPIPTMIATPQQLQYPQHTSHSQQQLRYYPMGTPIPQSRAPMTGSPPLVSDIPPVSLYDSEVTIESVANPLTTSAFLTPPSS